MDVAVYARVRCWLAFTLAIFAAGCARPTFRISLIEPVQLEVPAPGHLRFKDDAIAIEFRVTQDLIAFSLTNKTNGTIRIPWDDVAFVAVGGEAKAMAHRGRLPINRDLPQMPTVVPPSSTAVDDLIPWSHIEDGELLEGGILPVECGPARCVALEGMEGEIFGLHMPIEIEGVRRDYNFKFRIDEVISEGESSRTRKAH
jgi:hypothetical protein